MFMLPRYLHLHSQILFTCFSLFATSMLQAQSVGINSDGSAAHASAMLDVKSTNKGVLLPRMTLANRNAIAAPATGLSIYQTDNTPGFYYYNGATWSPVADHLGNHILSKNIMTGNFYISKTGISQGIQMLDNGAVSIRTKYSIGANVTDAENFRFDSLGNILAKGFVLDAGPSTIAANKIPATGAGTRFMWFSSRGALRFGRVSLFNPTAWDDVNMQDFTFAGGNDVVAKGYGAFAYGDQVRVNSVVGVGFGSSILVNGTAGFSAGASNTVNGFCGTAMGYTCRANGQGSVAIGYRCSATSDYSVALGYRAVNNGYEGTMAMGDESTTDSVRNTAYNQFVARYAGGYRLYTSTTIGGVAATGVFLNPSGNSWGSISDSTKKERFTYANKEQFLDRLAGLKLGSWNYKGDAGNRHYGPMAQEIFAAYGKDAFGEIGCDTVLTSADMDGIMIILLQGLEKRSTLQKEENAVLKNQLTNMTAEIKTVKEENALLKDQLANIQKMQQQLLAIQQQMHEFKLAVNTDKASITIDKLP